MIVRPQSGRDFCFSGWAGGGNSPPSAGIPRQVWYAVTKAVGKALKPWAAGLAWLVVLVLFVLLALAKINLCRSDHCVIATVSLRGLVSVAALASVPSQELKKDPDQVSPSSEPFLFPHPPRRDCYSQRNARMMYPIIDNRPMMAMVRLPQLSALHAIANALNRQ